MVGCHGGQTSQKRPENWQLRAGVVSEIILQLSAQRQLVDNAGGHIHQVCRLRYYLNGR